MPRFRLHRLRPVLAAALLLAGTACVPAAIGYGPWPVDPAQGPAGMSSEAWSHALSAHNRAMMDGQTRRSLLTVIDYSRPSSERRLWVVDLATGEVLMHEYVAHGVQSGGTWATSFSNRYGSNQSSLGTFVTANSYVGVRGLSLRLRGLEAEFNDRALARGIVIHGSPGVNESRARLGRLGRTNGCPAVSMEAARSLVRLIADGVVVFAWYPDRRFLARSDFVDRGAAAVRLSSGG